MDTLMRTKKLEALGFDRPKAEGLVLMVKDSIDEEVAKKSDIIKLDAKIDKVEATLKSEFKVLHKDLLLQLGGLIITMTGIIIGVLSGVISVYLK